MAPFFRITAQFEVLTPMFLAGADQNAPELRAPSIKGVMRFWYRALDPFFDRHERAIFGSGGDDDAGQSLLIVRCRPGDRCGESMTFTDARPDQFNQGSGRQTTNGLVYLGYPFGMGGNTSRRAMVPGARFSVEVSCRRAWKNDDQRHLRAALASLWALGHVGALGSRARRGFGAVALTGWQLTDREGSPVHHDTLSALPVLANEESHSAWESGARRGLSTIRHWFGAFGTNGSVSRQPHVGNDVNLVARKEGFAKTDWRRALLTLGAELQGFRQRRKPDYDMVKEFIRSNGSQPLQRLPDRAVFGLPLTFRFGSLPGARPITFTPVGYERHGSLLLLRPVLAGDKLYGTFLRLYGDLPGTHPAAGVRGSRWELGPPKGNLLDTFMAEQKGKV